MASSTPPSYSAPSTKRHDPFNAPDKPKDVSWFKLQLLFCDANAKGHTYAYNPWEFRQPEKLARVPVIFMLDRKNLSPDKNRGNLIRLVQISNPRIWYCKKKSDKKDVIGVAVGDPGDWYESKNAGARTTFLAVIAQLWETETYGTQVVEPDMFGTGANELQILLRDVK